MKLIGILFILLIFNSVVFASGESSDYFRDDLKFTAIKTSQQLINNQTDKPELQTEQKKTNLSNELILNDRVLNLIKYQNMPIRPNEIVYSEAQTDISVINPKASGNVKRP